MATTQLIRQIFPDKQHIMHSVTGNMRDMKNLLKDEESESLVERGNVHLLIDPKAQEGEVRVGFQQLDGTMNDILITVR